jgi:hypothetical protein
MEVECDVFDVKFAKERHKVLQATPEPVHAPCGDHINLATCDGPVQLVEARALVAPPCSRNTFISKLCCDVPPLSLCNGT